VLPLPGGRGRVAARRRFLELEVGGMVEGERRRQAAELIRRAKMRQTVGIVVGALCLAALIALAAGCAPAVRIPEEVKLEVPVACIRPEDVPQRPRLRSEADLLAMDRYRRTLAAWSDLKRLERYAAELEAIAAGCSRIPSSPPGRRRRRPTPLLEKRKPPDPPPVTAAPKGDRISEGCYHCKRKPPAP
jgi:hypothetical protein